MRHARLVPALLATAGTLVLPLAVAATPEEAARAYAESDWPAAAAAYGELVEANPADARSLYRLAVALRHTGELAAADARLDEALAAGVPAQFVTPERARLRLAGGDREGAVKAIAVAAQAGFTNAASLESDPAFAPIADDPDFVAALEQIRRNAAPCEHDARFREFDFWEGHWRVQDAAGNLQGENRIERGEAGCVLVERWSSAGGGTGMSMNYFDPAAEQWVQVWVSPTLQIDIRGGLDNGAMRLVGTVYYLQNGQRLPFRGTWTPQSDGVVRQHFEQSTDGGESWSTWFDGYYHPSEP